MVTVEIEKDEDLDEVQVKFHVKKATKVDFKKDKTAFLQFMTQKGDILSLSHDINVFKREFNNNNIDKLILKRLNDEESS